MRQAVCTVAILATLVAGCGSDATIPYRAWMGSWGGSLDGPDNTSITIPEKALSDQHEIYILKNTDATDLPEGTVMVYDAGTTGLELNIPAIFAVPSSLCRPAKWSLLGGSPWIGLPGSTECPTGFTCVKLTVLGSIACTKADK